MHRLREWCIIEGTSFNLVVITTSTIEHSGPPLIHVAFSLCMPVCLHTGSDSFSHHIIPTLYSNTHTHISSECWCSYAVSKAIDKTESVHEKGEWMASVDLLSLSVFVSSLLASL